MIAHSLRITGYDTEIEQREHAPQFLRVGLFLSACVGICLLSFFNAFEHRELIASYGLWYLLEHDGVALRSAITILLSIGAIAYTVSSTMLPDREDDRQRLFYMLLISMIAFVALYFYITYVDRPNWLASRLRENPVLQQTPDFRVYLADDTFLAFLPFTINNFLMGVVAFVRDGDFFATLHRRHLILGCIPATLALLTMLPYEALQLDHLHLFVAASALGYVLALTLSLHFEYGEEA